MGEHFYGFSKRIPKDKELNNYLLVVVNRFNKELNNYLLVVVNRFNSICVLIFIRKSSKPKRA
jgi:hypothetical protein